MSISKVTIGGNTIGITDLEEIFQEVRSASIGNVDDLKNLIMKKVKAKDYVPYSAEPTYREDLYEEYLVFIGELPARKQKSPYVKILLYGSSCYNCERLDGMIMEILSRSGIQADYQHVTDMREIARAGIISTPALAVDGKVILKGQVPEENRLEGMLLQAIEKARAGK